MANAPHLAFVPSLDSSGEGSDILPGSDIFGRGIDVFGEYCSGPSLKQKIVDIGPLDCTENPFNKCASKLVDVYTNKAGLDESVSGYSIAQLFQKLSEQVHSFTCKSTPNSPGWYYSLSSKIGGWNPDNGNTFCVPFNP